MLWSMLLLSPQALAQQESCSGYFNADFKTNLVEVEHAFGLGDAEIAADTLARIHKRLPCLEELVEREPLKKYAQLRALAAFFDQDETVAVSWGLLARSIDAEVPWPAQAPDGHPLRAMVDEAEMPALSTVEERYLVAPKKGGVFGNGILLGLPELPAEVPALVQQIDSEAKVVVGYWQDGGAFPDWLLSSTRLPVVAPKWYDGPVPELPSAGKTGGGSVPVARVGAAVGLAAVSGALYGLATVSARRFEEAGTVDDMVSARSSANLLVVGCGLAGAGAVGAGVTVFLDGRAAGLQVRF